LPLRLTWGAFHIRESLWPGLGMPLLLLGLVGLAAPLIAARERRIPLALIMIFTVLWYAIHEVSPLKPYPDFPRYMLPLVPLLAILATSFIYELLSSFDRRGITAAIVVLLAAVPALWTSVRTNFPDVDPRSVVPPIVTASGARVVIDRYADYDNTRRILGLRLRPTKDTADIVVTANLTYDRFDNFAAPKKPAPDSMAGYYLGLNAFPRLEVSNGRPTMGYFNPVLQVVALDASADRLKRIAEEIQTAAPTFTVRLIGHVNAN
jgi:hypothetical protein